MFHFCSAVTVWMLHTCYGPSLVLGQLTPDYTVTPCPGDVVALNCTAPASSLIWGVPGINPIAVDMLTTIPLEREQYTVTSFILNTMPVMSVSSLSFPADAVTIVCSSSGNFMEEYNVQVVDTPSEPTALTHTVTTLSSNGANLTVQWVTPTDSGGIEVRNYTVTISPPAQLSAAVVTSTSVIVTDADYNVDYTVSVVATNCAGNSSTATLPFRINGCPPLTDPMNGAFGPIANRLQGTVVTFQCDSGYQSPVTMITCEGPDTLMWSPDPETIACTSLTPTTAPPMNCTEQLSPPQNGSVTSDHTVPAVPGTQVTFQCDSGLFPDMIMTATCLPTGQWDRDPRNIICRTTPVSCDLPDPPLNGLMLDPNTNTTEGSVISLQCEPGYMLVGGGTATCRNSGSWEPDLAMLCVVAAQESTLAPLSTDATIAVSVVISSVLSALLGFLAGLLVMHLFTRKKAVYSPTEGQANVQPTVPAGPVYEDVLPAPKEEIELKTNDAYGPVRQ